MCLLPLEQLQVEHDESLALPSKRLTPGANGGLVFLDAHRNDVQRLALPRRGAWMYRWILLLRLAEKLFS